MKILKNTSRKEKTQEEFGNQKIDNKLFVIPVKAETRSKQENLLQLMQQVMQSGSDKGYLGLTVAGILPGVCNQCRRYRWSSRCKGKKRCFCTW